VNPEGPTVSIRIKIAAIVTLLVYFPAKLEQQQLSAIKQKAQSISNSAAFSISPALFFDDTDAALEVLESVKQNRDLEYAVVTNTSGEVFAQYNIGKAEQANFLQLESGGFTRDESVMQIVQPVVHQDQVIGRFYLGLSLSELKEAVAISRSVVLNVSLAVFFIGVTAALVFSVLITRRLSRMVQTTEVISRGDLSHRAEVASRDEVGQLARSFNRMVDSLEAAYSELEKANQQLEARVEERTKELKKQRDLLMERTEELSALNKELKAFNFSVSHNLRNPMLRIDGFCRLMLDSYSENLDEQGVHYLTRIRVASQSVIQLIKDMLQLSQTAIGELDRETVDLSLLARDVARKLKKKRPGENVQFVIADGIRVRGDNRLLRIVLENLLGNALKFTGKNPSARIEFGVTEKDGKQVYFVRDDGVGFDMADADRLFGAFQRLHSISEFEGTGVGLATVESVIKRHGGEIWAEAEVGKGATFYFTLE